MKKIRMFFAVTILLLITAGVFAGKNRYLTTGGLYIYVSGGFVSLSGTTTWIGLSTTGSIPATITDDFGSSYSLYFYTGSFYSSAYPLGW